ncbi:MAG: hypothetical protein JST87_00150 [Bacteroidetes bacterium]|nr:hypothetical protein [Bacteroidota bacterium]MBS1935970.1 hypothetical protein [Bacteroidota bacterium]
MKKETFVVPSLLLSLLCIAQFSFAQKRILNICVLHPPELTTKLPNEEIVYFPNTPKSKQVTIYNTGNVPIALGKIYLDDIDADQFELHSGTLVRTLPGGKQGPETCSNTTLPVGGKCTLRVVLLNNTPANLFAMLHVPTKVPCELKVPVRELFGVQ